MHEGRRVARNAALMIAKQVIMAALSVVFVGFVARTVGVAAWGELQASLAITAVASVIAGLGVRGYVAREIAVRPELGPEHLGAALAVRGVAGAVVLSLVAIGTSVFQTGQGRWLVVIAAASQLATLLYTTMWLSFEAHERFEFILYAELVARLFVLALATIVVASGLGIVAAATVFAIGNVIELVLTFYFLTARLYRPRLVATFPELVEIAKKSLPFGFVGAILGTIRQCDRVLLRWFGNEEAVGIFSAGWVLVEQLEVVSDLVFGAAFAVGMRLYAREPNRFAQLYGTAIVVAAALGLPMAAGVCLLSSDIIELVYGGREFASAASTLRVVAWHVPVTFAFHVVSLPLVAAKREAHLGAILLPALIAIVLLDMWLVPQHGALGAAMTALVVAIAVLAASMTITREYVRAVPLRRIGAAIIATALMTLAAHVAHTSFGMWAAIAAGAVTHATALVVFRVITPGQTRALIRPTQTSFYPDKRDTEIASKHT